MLFVCNGLLKRREAGCKVCNFCFLCDVDEKDKFTVSPVKGGAAEKAGGKGLVPWPLNSQTLLSAKW